LDKLCGLLRSCFQAAEPAVPALCRRLWKIDDGRLGLSATTGWAAITAIVATERIL